ncbi:hypothetical protein [Halogeometricum sp. CBA1124]|uniref:hypothetical protein n=1 Tax=Halogeometricum sp. CBA1124 TaxID=2668071 RepID=UPI001E527459|nr:hypothetical protein [Halogeometricum sp. CBA1124]
MLAVHQSVDDPRVGRLAFVLLVREGDVAPASRSASVVACWKAMRVPSGLHSMPETPPGTSVTRSASPPAIGRTHNCGRSSSAPRVETKASRSPDGLHRGAESTPSLMVSRRGSALPSVGTTYTVCSYDFSSVGTLRTNATRVPSGETCGSSTCTMSW